MTLTRTLTFAGLGATTLAALLTAQGCGSTTSGGTESSSGTNSSSSSGGSNSGSKTTTSGGNSSTSGTSASSVGNDKTDAGRPPSRAGSSTTSTKPHNLAMRNLYLGDETPNSSFTMSTTAWETFGFNIDGLITTPLSKDVCTLDTAAGATTADQADGTNGIDNNFGAHIMGGLLGSVISSSAVSGDIASGKFTIEVETIGLDGTATQTATGLTGQLFAGGSYGGTPAVNASTGEFDLTDNWPVNGSLLDNPASIDAGSQIQFTGAYITNGTWVSGDPATIALNISVSGVTLGLQIHAGVITMPLTVDGAGQYHAKVGQISGVIETSELLNAINVIGGKLGYCSVISAVLPSIQASQDIIISGSSVSNTAGTPCNGISIGLDFDADEIALPSTIIPPVDAGGGGAPCGSGS